MEPSSLLLVAAVVGAAALCHLAASAARAAEEVRKTSSKLKRFSESQEVAVGALEKLVELHSCAANNFYAEISQVRQAVSALAARYCQAGRDDDGGGGHNGL